MLVSGLRLQHIYAVSTKCTVSTPSSVRHIYAPVPDHHAPECNASAFLRAPLSIISCLHRLERNGGVRENCMRACGATACVSAPRLGKCGSSDDVCPPGRFAGCRTPQDQALAPGLLRVRSCVRGRRTVRFGLVPAAARVRRVVREHAQRVELEEVAHRHGVGEARHRALRRQAARAPAENAAASAGERVKAGTVETVGSDENGGGAVEGRGVGTSAKSGCTLCALRRF
eukprot:6213034-Pleurochrysis_carterae.AAC.1